MAEDTSEEDRVNDTVAWSPVSVSRDHDTGFLLLERYIFE